MSNQVRKDASLCQFRVSGSGAFCGEPQPLGRGLGGAAQQAARSAHRLAGPGQRLDHLHLAVGHEQVKPSVAVEISKSGDNLLVAVDAEALDAALDGSLAVSAVNLPFASAGVRGEPFLALAERLGLLASDRDFLDD